jgi:hypothetical protein
MFLEEGIIGRVQYSPCRAEQLHQAHKGFVKNFSLNVNVRNWAGLFDGPRDTIQRAEKAGQPRRDLRSPTVESGLLAAQPRPQYGFLALGSRLPNSSEMTLSMVTDRIDLKNLL